MEKLLLDLEIQIALNNVLEYLWDDEEQGYEAEPDENHIFVSIKRLRDFLDQV